MLGCRGWITLTSLTDNLKAQNIAQTYPMDVLNGAKHPFFPKQDSCLWGEPCSSAYHDVQVRVEDWLSCWSQPPRCC